MPPIVKIDKEKILQSALYLVNEEGIGALNARSLANKLTSSVQPIYYQFSNMDELKIELIKYAYKDYERYICNTRHNELDYLSTGIGYIKFAKEKPNLFNLLFMIPYPQKIEDPTLEHIYELIMRKSGLSLEIVKEFHFNMWIYVHGIATMVYTKIIEFDNSQIEKLLRDQYDALIRRYSNV